MAQGLNSAYFTKDYKFRHTMNPALANEQNYVSIPALEASMSTCVETSATRT